MKHEKILGAGGEERTASSRASISRAEFKIDSNFHAVGDLAQAIGYMCSAIASIVGLDEEIPETIRLCVAEALNNIVEHAYSEQGGHTISGAVSFSDGIFRVHLIDKGKPLPRGEIPVISQDFDPLDSDNLPEGGFGWMLITTQMDGVEYERQGDTNVLTLLKKI